MSQARSQNVETPSDPLPQLSTTDSSTDKTKSKNLQKNVSLFLLDITELKSLWKQGKVAELIEKSEAMTINRPNEFWGWNMLGLAKKTMGDFICAEVAFKKAIAIDPNNVETQHNLALSLQSQRKLPEAIKIYQRAISTNPVNFGLQNDFGNALQALGQHRQAIEIYQKCLLLKPTNPHFLYYNLGNSFLARSMYKKALNAYENALLTSVNFAEAHNGIGNVFQAQGDYENALKSYKKCLLINPKFFIAQTNMANVLQLQGDLEGAAEAYDDVLRMNPNYHPALQGSVKLLKTHSPVKKKYHPIFEFDRKIKKMNNKLLSIGDRSSLSKYILEGLSFVDASGHNLNSGRAQIFRTSSVDLNCRRHTKIFKTQDIIPEFCFGCFKVQIDVVSFQDLVKLTSLFYNLEINEDLPRKTLVELRPNVLGNYKGLVYCRGIEQAEEVRKLMDNQLTGTLQLSKSVHIKRGCSEFPQKFPEFEKVSTKLNHMMDYPLEWKNSELLFDKNNEHRSRNKEVPSLTGFCLSDFYVIQKWLDYAKGLGDPSVEVFKDLPVKYVDIYQIALRR